MPQEPITPPSCNANGRELIKRFEKCRLKAYRDAAGVPTIGWGQTGHNIVDGLVWSQEQADAAFDKHLHEEVEIPLDRLIRYDLSSNQFSALCCFVYNIGVGNFAKSAVLRDINAGDFDDVPVHIMVWCHANGQVLEGLRTRREEEIKLWEMPDDEPPEPLLVA